MSTDIQLGRLESIDPRECWKDEARDFTPWLAQAANISLLGQTLDMDLEVQATEESVGPFRADILCHEVNTRRTVLVENQLERTDHNHLGQILTYAAGLDAVVIVWIARSFTEEHRAALDWLNHVTNESVDFFGLEVELWRIGSSPPAPKFNVVCKPNAWSKSIIGPEKELTDKQKLQIEYWSAYRDYLKSKGVSAPKPQRQNWMDFGGGRDGFVLSTVLSNWDLFEGVTIEPEVRIDMVVTHKTEAKRFYTMLLEQRAAIEADTEEPLCWYNPESSRQCRIFCRRQADYTDRSDWPNQFAWLYEHLMLFKRVFGPRIKAL